MFPMSIIRFKCNFPSNNKLTERWESQVEVSNLKIPSWMVLELFQQLSLTAGTDDLLERLR